MAELKDISLFEQKASLTGDEEIIINGTQKVTTQQIANLAHNTVVLTTEMASYTAEELAEVLGTSSVTEFRQWITEGSIKIIAQKNSVIYYLLRISLNSSNTKLTYGASMIISLDITLTHSDDTITGLTFDE